MVPSRSATATAARPASIWPDWAADAEDDAGGCRAERAEVELVAGAGGHVQSEQRIVAGAVVLGGQPESGGIRSGLPREAGRDRAGVADQRDERGHRRAEAAALVGLADAGARGQHRLTVGQLLGGGRLVRHQGADQPGMPGHQGQRVDRAAAAAEDIGRPGVQRLDQPRRSSACSPGSDPGGWPSVRWLRSVPRGS